MPGPTLAISKETHAMKYRGAGESFEDAMQRVANVLGDSSEHTREFLDALVGMRFLPAGRVQAAIGAERRTTPFNCFVMGTIPDSMDGIMDIAKEAAITMRLGGGVGYDFSTLRPRGTTIHSLGSCASGPVSFMGIFNSVCGTIASAGHRRGAQMGILRVDHPDIREFIHAKRNEHALTNFNISIAVTDKFMRAVANDTDFPLVFDGKVYETVRARDLWEETMQSTYDWAEPGVVFIDSINADNNLWYCERIAATNPCSEQPLGPYGACLLGSFNLTRYVTPSKEFDFSKFLDDVRVVVRAMDNVIEHAVYPLPKQEAEALSYRRMGLGVTGLANAIESMGHPYATQGFLARTRCIMRMLRDATYSESAKLAREKGAFPRFRRDKYLDGAFIQRLPVEVQDLIGRHGIRNSHLVSIAPTGTISLCADNVSSGIEPVFAHSFTRDVWMADGPRTEIVRDYGIARMGVAGRTAAELSVDDHLDVLQACQPFVDSAISKTVNVPADYPFEDFRHIYMKAWYGRLKAVSTFRNGGMRRGVLRQETDGAACTYDAETGRKSCE